MARKFRVVRRRTPFRRRGVAVRRSTRRVVRRRPVRRARR